MPGKNQERLSNAKVGKEFMISKIQSTPETNQRLRELGFSENTKIRTIMNGSSKLICELNNTRFGVHHHIAKDIIISPLK